MLYTRSFTVLHFAFRSVIQFELIFVKRVISVSRISFLYVDIIYYISLPLLSHSLDAMESSYFFVLNSNLPVWSCILVLDLT